MAAHKRDGELRNGNGVKVNGNGVVAHKSGDESSNGVVAHERDGEPNLMLFSAYSATSVEAQIDSFRKYTKGTSATLRDLAHTLANRREQKPHRAYAVTSDVSDIQASLTQVVQPQSVPRVAWVFTGQGAQWPEMGAELIATNATFRATVRRLDKFLLSLPTPPPWTIEGTWKNKCLIGPRTPCRGALIKNIHSQANYLTSRAPVASTEPSSATR